MTTDQSGESKKVHQSQAKVHMPDTFPNLGRKADFIQTYQTKVRETGILRDLGRDPNDVPGWDLKTPEDREQEESNLRIVQESLFAQGYEPQVEKRRFVISKKAFFKQTDEGFQIPEERFPDGQIVFSPQSTNEWRISNELIDQEGKKKSLIMKNGQKVKWLGVSNLTSGDEIEIIDSSGKFILFTIKVMILGKNFIYGIKELTQL